MGELRINLPNFGKVAITAFVGVWLINRALSYAGFGQWQA